MLFMDFRDYRGPNAGPEDLDDDGRPTFLYAMPISPTRVFFEVSRFWFIRGDVE